MDEKHREKRGPGRPRHAERTVVLTLRVTETLAKRADEFAQSHGMNRNQAGAELLQRGLDSLLASGGYNPLKGCYD